MTHLNQIISVEKGEKTRAEQGKTAVYHLIQRTEALSGISRSYRPKDDDGDQLPGESKHVQATVENALAQFGKASTRLIDVTLTKESGNQEAKADVVIDGQTLVADAPVSFLIFLEKQLVEAQVFLKALPVLDPATRWESDDATGAGVYRSDTKTTARNVKVLRNHVKAPATDRHPAQVETFNEDVLAGYWDTIAFSGAVPAARKAQLLERVADAINAVKQAREEANSITVADRKAGSEIYDFLFAR